MINLKFQIKTTIYYSPNSVQKITPIVKELGGNNVFVLIEKFLVKNQRIGALINDLKAGGLKVFVYDQMLGEPTSEQIEAAVTTFKSGCYDLIIAIGGGSRIDSAKAVAFLATNPGQLTDYEGLNRVKNPKAPLIAVNTTAGTGSDVSAGTVITDSATHRKIIIVSPFLFPEAAIGDPYLTVSLPKKMTAFTGIDALTHAIEGFVCQKAQPVTDSMACQAIETIGKSLGKCFDNPEDLDARMKMLLGQLLAGMVISHTSTGLVHAMARPFGVYFNQPHGLCNALFLPYATKLSVKGNEPKYRQVISLLGGAMKGDSAEQASRLLKEFCDQLEIPSIEELGINYQQYLGKAEQMAEDAILSGSVANNPTQPSKEEIVKIYEMAYKRDLKGL